MAKTKIKNIHARKSWDLSGNPAIEIDVTLRYGARGRATAPIADPDHQGDQVLEQGIEFISIFLRNSLKGKSATDQAGLDQHLAEISLMPELLPIIPSILMALSQAILLAASDTEKLPLWQYLGPYLGHSNSNVLPLPVIDILFCSRLIASHRRISEYSVIPLGADQFSQALSWNRQVHQEAQKINLNSGATDEEILEALTRTIESAGLRPAEDVAIAIRIAKPYFFETGSYLFNEGDSPQSTDFLSGQYVDWITKYPVISIEAPFAVTDLEGYRRLTWAIGKKTQVIAPPLGVNLEKIGNTVLLSTDSAQTISDIWAQKIFADERGLGATIQAGANGLMGPVPIHLAVGWGINQIKSNGFCDPSSMSVWREAIRIAETIGEIDNLGRPFDGTLPPRNAFPWG